MEQQTFEGNVTVTDENSEKTIQTDNMELTVKEEQFGGVTSYGLDFTMPVDAAITAMFRFKYVQRQCTSSMYRAMYSNIMHARNSGRDSVSFYDSFRSSGWSTHLSKALNTSVKDPKRQEELDEFRELLDNV